MTKKKEIKLNWQEFIEYITSGKMKEVNKTDIYIVRSDHPLYPELEKMAEEDKK